MVLIGHGMQAQAISVVQFSANSYNVAENTAAAIIVVERTNDLNTVVSVDYAFTNRTATAGLDYAGVAGTLQFAAGVTRQSISVPILNDGLVEGTETFQILLSNPSGESILGTRTNALVAISSNDRGIQFEFSGYSVSEGDGAIRLAVVRDDDGDYPVTVDYATSDGAAVQGVDYVQITGTLTFAAGETVKPLQVPVVNNSFKQTSRAFRLSLSNPAGGAVLGTPQTATVTILDNDSGVQLEFVHYLIHETEGSVAIKVLRGKDVDLPAFSVQYATTNFTAIAGLDYTEVSGTLSFASGEVEKVLSVPVLYREEATPDLHLKLTLDNPSNGVVLGRITSATITVLDMAGMVPHRFDGIRAMPNGSVELALTGGTPSRFAPYFDLYPIETSTDLRTWVPWTTLLRRNVSSNALTHLDQDLNNAGARFYRTPEANFITPFLPPTGPYAVGVASLLVTDPSRTNRYGVPTNSSFMVNVWYPAEAKGGGHPNLWLDREYASDPAWGMALVLSVAPFFHTYAIRGAPLLRGPRPYPVILHSHGGWSDRNERVDLTEELASHGYLVVVPDHSHAYMSVFPDGRVINTRNLRVETWSSILMVNDSIADMRFLLEELKRWNANDGWLAGMADADNVAVAGYSMGAWLPMELCRSDTRCRAAVLLELGVGLGEVVNRLSEQDVRSPLLMLNASDNNTTKYYDRASQDATWVQIGNTVHTIFTSHYWWVRPGDMPDGLEVSRTIRGYTLWFLNKHLKGATDPVPSRSDYPRVIGLKQK